MRSSHAPPESCAELGLALAVIGTTLVVAHGPDAPTEPEWAQLKAAWRDHPEISTQLVFTRGGGPNVVQRKESLDVLNARRGGSPRTAVMTHSLFVRGIVTALSWFATNQLAAFGPGALDEAFDFLEITDELQRQQLTKRLAILRRSVGG